MRILNLYSGIGGNRKLWSPKHKVTAVEYNPVIAKYYQKQFPKDKVLVEDAHLYLEKNYREFDYIWTSCPCQTHSKINRSLTEKRFADMKLYEEILFLKHNFNGGFTVENVIPYYQPLIIAQQMSGHLFWANFKIPLIEMKFPGTGNHRIVEKEKNYHKLKWLGFSLTQKDVKGIRLRQVIDNTIHPKIGLHILNTYEKYA